MAASIPWSEILLCLWTLVVGGGCYMAGRFVSTACTTNEPRNYDYAIQSRKPREKEQQEYDDPWSAAMRGKGDREDTV